MTAPPDDRAQLIEAITRQVLATLAGPGVDGANCATCSGGCAARCAPRVAEVVAGYANARVPVQVGSTVEATVVGDADGLRRVAINLIDNAVRYANSDVTIALESDGPAGAPTVTMTVTDDGRGVPAAELERVFDRFYRVQASRSRESGGTGLGLSIVRDVVRAHGGSVRVAPRPDGRSGLQAIVVLPVAGPVT